MRSGKDYTRIGKYADCWQCSEADAAVSTRYLAVTMKVSDRCFIVSTEVIFHPPSWSGRDRTGVAGERFRQSDRVRSLVIS